MPVKNPDIDNYYPYNKIRQVEVDGQQMVRIPKVYVKTVTYTDEPYKGKTAYFISETKEDGFHLHPAFMNDGAEMSAIDFACYDCGYIYSGESFQETVLSKKNVTGYYGDSENPNTRVSLSDAISKGKERNKGNYGSEQWGWHCWNIYEHALLARLMMIEYGAAWMRSKDHNSKDYSEDYMVYRGIYMPAGDDSHPFWLPGLKVKNGTYWIYDNQGSCQYVDTGVKIPGVGWPTAFSTAKGENFDLGDVFVGSAVSDKKDDALAADWQCLREYASEANFATGFSVDSHANNNTYPRLYDITCSMGSGGAARSNGMFSLSMPIGGLGTTKDALVSTDNAKYVVDAYSNCDNKNNPTINYRIGPLHFRLARYVV